ncbi:MAG: TetR/AcrR family transcriptional regulator [Microbacterium sp.]|uniref:TetR/AcrR family transcriptional regulator n=1 Tax=Microbacterium sp. TaxID=51671 RepID=UPI003A862677
MAVEEGLRARKQRQTRDAIHRAAVQLALERGPDAATVADISAIADVSQRTFFNYYPSKEDAIVGLHEGMPGDDELDAFRAGPGDDLVDDTLQLLLGVFSPADDELAQQRRGLLATHPQLIQRHWSRLLGVEQRTATAVAARMRASKAFTDIDIDLAARALVVACSNVLRLSIRSAIDDGTFPDDLDTRIATTMRTLREALRILP